MFAGLVEHPLPLGWFALPLARLRDVVAYTFLESAPWATVAQLPSSGRARLRSAIRRPLNRLVLPLIDFAAITQPAYEDLLRPRTPRVLTPASWFLPDELAPNETIDRRVESARSAIDPPTVLYAGRLDAAKGVGQLLDALRLLDGDGKGPITIKFVGTGPMASDVDSCATRLSAVNVQRLEPVTYGDQFLSLFDDVDCLIVPSLSDEQPRIVFDAASQGVPVICSATTGLSSIVEDGVTGTLVRPGGVEPLALALGRLREDDERRRYAEMGRRAWFIAKDYNHVTMHHRRAVFIAKLFEDDALSRRRRASSSSRP
jgi:glycosyltransferase involved in cell wall biosynthesis